MEEFTNRWMSMLKLWREPKELPRWLSNLQSSMMSLWQEQWSNVMFVRPHMSQPSSLLKNSLWSTPLLPVPPTDSREMLRWIVNPNWKKNDHPVSCRVKCILQLYYLIIDWHVFQVLIVFISDLWRTDLLRWVQTKELCCLQKIETTSFALFMFSRIKMMLTIYLFIYLIFKTWKRFLRLINLFIMFKTIMHTVHDIREAFKAVWIGFVVGLDLLTFKFWQSSIQGQLTWKLLWIVHMYAYIDVKRSSRGSNNCMMYPFLSYCANWKLGLDSVSVADNGE